MFKSCQGPLVPQRGNPTLRTASRLIRLPFHMTESHSQYGTEAWIIGRRGPRPVRRRPWKRFPEGRRTWVLHRIPTVDRREGSNERFKSTNFSKESGSATPSASSIHIHSYPLAK